MEKNNLQQNFNDFMFQSIIDKINSADFDNVITSYLLFLNDVCKQLLVERFSLDVNYKDFFFIKNLTNQYWYYDDNKNIFCSSTANGLYKQTKGAISILENNTEKLLHTYENYVAIPRIIPENIINYVYILDINKRITDLKTLQRI